MNLFTKYINYYFISSCEKRKNIIIKRKNKIVKFKGKGVARNVQPLKLRATQEYLSFDLILEDDYGDENETLEIELNAERIDGKITDGNKLCVKIYKTDTSFIPKKIMNLTTGFEVKASTRISLRRRFWIFIKWIFRIFFAFVFLVLLLFFLINSGVLREDAAQKLSDWLIKHSNILRDFLRKLIS